jgi:undecaprenyl-diphosphatase
MVAPVRVLIGLHADSSLFARLVKRVTIASRCRSIFALSSIFRRLVIVRRFNPRMVDRHGPMRLAARARLARDATVLLVCALLAGVALRLHGGELDRHLFWGLNALGPRAPWLWSQLSVAGLGLSALLAVGCAGAHGARTFAALLLLLTCGGLLVHAVKWALMFERPFAVLGPGLVEVVGEPLRQRSMPSGHSALAFGLGAWILVGTDWWRAIRLAVAVVAVVVALSRVAVGAHWPSDVVAGAALGIAVAWALHRMRLVDAGARWLRSLAGARVVASVIACGTLGMALIDTGYPLAVVLQGALAIAGGVGALRWALHGLGRLRVRSRRDALEAA